MVFSPPPYARYFYPLTHGIPNPLPMVFWSPIHGIFTPPSHGISNPLPMVFSPLYMVFWLPYPCYLELPTHGISTPIHVILTPILMLYRTPYPSYFNHTSPWYFDPPSYLLIRNEGVKIPWGSMFNTGGSIYHGWKLTLESIYHGGQNTIWHRSFLHSSPITGFVTRLTRVNLVTNPVMGDEWRKDQCHMVFWPPW
jgi:hypothetical protein